jgi:hypothetical protein
LGFTAYGPDPAKIGNDLRLSAAVALLFLACVLLGTSTAARVYLHKHEDESGLGPEAIMLRQKAFLLVVYCASLFILKFSCELRRKDLTSKDFEVIRLNSRWSCFDPVFALCSSELRGSLVHAVYDPRQVTPPATTSINR